MAELLYVAMDEVYSRRIRISMPSMSVARMGPRYLGIYIVERDAVHSM